MIAHTCRRCDSTAFVKNGHTRSGQQKMRCKDCNFSSTLELQDLKRRLKEEQVEKLSVLDKAAPIGLCWRIQKLQFRSRLIRRVPGIENSKSQ